MTEQLAHLPMKALTVRAPWAQAMFRSVAPKDIENRTYQTEHRGRLAIHVAKRVDAVGYDFLGMNESDIAATWRDLGMIVGTVDLTGCHPAESAMCDRLECYDSPWAFWADKADPERIGKKPRRLWHWTLEHPRRFETPIRARGALQLWEPDPVLAYLIGEAVVL